MLTEETAMTSDHEVRALIEQLQILATHPLLAGPADGSGDDGVCRKATTTLEALLAARSGIADAEQERMRAWLQRQAETYPLNEQLVHYAKLFAIGFANNEHRSKDDAD
jgi:hypothetical protein